METNIEIIKKEMDRFSNEPNVFDTSSTSIPTDISVIICNESSATQTLSPSFFRVRRTQPSIYQNLLSKQNFDWLTPTHEELLRLFTIPVDDFSISLKDKDPSENIRKDNLLWFTRSPYPFSNEIAKRLQTLIEAPIEIDEEPIREESINGLFTFLKEHKNIGKPTLSVSNHGYIRARWKKNAQQSLTIEFLNGGRCNFVVFDYDIETKESSYNTGSSKLASLSKTLKALSSWFVDQL